MFDVTKQDVHNRGFVTTKMDQKKNYSVPKDHRVNKSENKEKRNKPKQNSKKMFQKITYNRKHLPRHFLFSHERVNHNGRDAREYIPVRGIFHKLSPGMYSLYQKSYGESAAEVSRIRGEKFGR